MFLDLPADNLLEYQVLFGFLTLYALMDSSFWFDTINFGCSTVNIERSQVIFSNTGPQIRVRNCKLFLYHNICCGYSKEPFRRDSSFEHPKHMLILMDKNIMAISR